MAAELASGEWEMEKSENFDEYMKAVGVGFPKRVIGNAAKPKQVIDIKDGVWTITTSTTISKVVLVFELNKKFEEATADGRKVMSVYTVEGNKLIATQEGEVDSTITREFTKNSFIMTLKAKDVTCTRHYRKAE